jgi:hypothetical protein
MASQTLSKSDYLLYLKHPAWLWLKKNDPKKLPPIDANLQALFDAGHEFEAYAEALFPGGTTLGWDPKNYGSYQSLPGRTLAAIQKSTPVIFQGRLEANGITAIFDVLVRVDDHTFDLYEIKSSTKAKDEHIDDLAFQTHLLELSGYTVRNVGVVHVNSKYVRSGAINTLELCSQTDVTESVKARLPLTVEKIAEAIAVSSQPNCPDLSPRFASSGFFKEWLEIYNSLNPDLPKDSIYQLNRLNPNLVGLIEDSGAKVIADIPDDLPLKKEQQRQIAVVKSGQRSIDKPRVQEFLSQLQYPLYFLDYETLMKTVPPYDGTRPYQQIPFQYSLHIIETPGAEPIHKEYLHRDATNPCDALIARMREDVGDTGSVIVWYEDFEKGRNGEMAEQHPDHSEWLLNLNGRVVDLMIPFFAGWINDSAFCGSASIKKVLPVLVPDLSYSVLAIHEGGTAQRLWMEAVLDQKHPDKREQIMADLIEYCKLDTLAMVRIYEDIIRSIRT